MNIFGILFVVCVSVLSSNAFAEVSQSEIKEKRMAIEGESEIKVRDAKVVAERAIALLAVIGLVHDTDKNRIKAWVTKNHIETYLSNSERSAFEMGSLNKKQEVAFSWRSEALVSLLWALGVIERFPSLNAQYSIYENPNVAEIIRSPQKFIDSASLRSDQELEEMENNLYNQHWRVRDAQLFSKPMPKELDSDIVYERRYGMSWVVGWGDDWDDVPTDT